MQTYHIEIQEMLVRVVDVEALSLDSAFLKVQKMYNNEETFSQKHCHIYRKKDDVIFCGKIFCVENIFFPESF